MCSPSPSGRRGTYVLTWVRVRVRVRVRLGVRVRVRVRARVRIRVRVRVDQLDRARLRLGEVVGPRGHALQARRVEDAQRHEDARKEEVVLQRVVHARGAVGAPRQALLRRSVENLRGGALRCLVRVTVRVRASVRVRVRVRARARARARVWVRVRVRVRVRSAGCDAETPPASEAS